MLLAIIGGILVARSGFHLYRDGAGHGRDHAAFEVGPIRMKAHSVGSVVMASAFLWAWAGVALSPNLDKNGNNFRIYSQIPDRYTVSPAILDISMPLPGNETPNSSSNVPNTPFDEENLLKEALEKSNASKSEFPLTLNGKRAVFDTNNVKLRTEPTSERYFFTATLENGENSVPINFYTQIKDSRVFFVPQLFGVDIEPVTQAATRRDPNIN